MVPAEKFPYQHLRGLARLSVEDWCTANHVGYPPNDGDLAQAVDVFMAQAVKEGATLPELREHSATLLPTEVPGTLEFFLAERMVGPGLKAENEWLRAQVERLNAENKELKTKNEALEVELKESEAQYLEDLCNYRGFI